MSFYKKYVCPVLHCARLGWVFDIWPLADNTFMDARWQSVLEGRACRQQNYDSPHPKLTRPERQFCMQKRGDQYAPRPLNRVVVTVCSRSGSPKLFPRPIKCMKIFAFAQH